MLHLHEVAASLKNDPSTKNESICLQKLLVDDRAAVRVQYLTFMVSPIKPKSFRIQRSIYPDMISPKITLKKFPNPLLNKSK